MNTLRNIGIIAHVDAGKTTTTERILWYCGKTHRRGEVHDGNTVMDFDPQERARGITINSAATTVFWKDAQINVIDTPGHIDFNIEVNRSLRVLDGAVVVFDGVAGVEPQTETNWRLADQYRVPRLCFVNKLDRVGADFIKVVDQIDARLGEKSLVLQLPLGTESDFRGVIDLVEMRALVWPNAEGAQPEWADIPEDQLHRAGVYRQRLLGKLATQDDELLAACVSDEPIAPEQLTACIRRQTLKGWVTPVLCGSAFRNRGIEPLLDAVVRYLPAPGDLDGDHEAVSDGPLAALAFKVLSDDHGTLVFVRVYRGRLRPGDSVLNTSTGRKERIGRLYEIHADDRKEITAATAGAIVGVMGLKDTVTGQTLADPNTPVVLEQIQVPVPVIELSIEPRTSADQQKLGKALQVLVREDPSLRLKSDPESGQTLLAGMGELQLEVTLEKLRSRFDVEVSTGRPQVAYRKSIDWTAERAHMLKKQTGGPGQYAEVRIRLEPLVRGEGLQFVDQVKGGAIPREYIPSVEAGFRRAMQAGNRDFPCVDLRATLLDGSFHEKDSSAMAFELAGRDAVSTLLAERGTHLLEPMMAVEVVVPAEYVGPSIGDLARRRGNVCGQDGRGNDVVIQAEVPLAEMFGYIGTLRALTSGRGQFTMQFERYDRVPDAIAAKVVAQ